MIKIAISLVALSALFAVTHAQDFCLQCTSSVVNTNCIDPEANEFNSTCYGAPRNQSCYSRIAGGNVERGCLAQLDNATIADCDSETCQICVGAQMPGQPNGCNVGLFPSNRLLCHICSGGINSTCAGRIEATATPCPLFAPDDQCYVARPNGGYERGCLSSTRRCDSERCFVCEGHRCNFVDFSGASNLLPTTKILSFAIISFIIAKFN